MTSGAVPRTAAHGVIKLTARGSNGPVCSEPLEKIILANGYWRVKLLKLSQDRSLKMVVVPASESC